MLRLSPEGRMYAIAVVSAFATLLTGATCAVLASTGSSTTGAEAIVMAVVGAASLMLIVGTSLIIRERKDVWR